MAFADGIADPILGGTKATRSANTRRSSRWSWAMAYAQARGSIRRGSCTAGHCVNTPSGRRRVADASRAHRERDGLLQHRRHHVRGAGTIVTASATIPDPMYVTSGSHDSGLIKLTTPMTSVTCCRSSSTSPRSRRADRHDRHASRGFGESTAGDGNSVGVENVVQQTVVSCTADVPGGNANLLCYDQTSGKGKCEGDSGGPSFAMISGKMLEVGITSFGDQNCATLGADTRVDAESAFILANVMLQTSCT